MLENASLEPERSWLGWFFRGIVVLGFFILVGRLFELQIIKGSYYRELANGNRARIVSIQAPRGKILARDGQILADNIKIAKTVVFDPKEGYTKKIATAGTPEEEIINEYLRDYPTSQIAAHVTGYLGEVNSEELGKVNQNCREKGVQKLGAQIGRNGLEKYYDCQLRGIDGEEIVEVDTLGNKKRILGRRNPIAGRDLKTTIDAKLQKKAFEAMEGKKGAVIISKIDGEILALVSSPSYDPNLFIYSKDRKEELKNILINKDLPLFNRAISGAYPPGSLFKVVTSIAGFEEEAIKTDFKYVDTGIISVDEYEYTNWYFTQYGGTEGEIDTIRALARSTDTFFYEIGKKMGANAIVDWSKNFGLGEKTGIDLPGEIIGLVPSPEWKKAVKGERWYLGNTFHFSIGQGDLTTTPIGIHRVFTAIANNGVLCNTHITQNAGSECRNLNIKPEHLAIVKEGLKQACDPKGTATPFFSFTPEVACKTGTAETIEEDVTHAWFSIFAPLEDPEIVVTVLVEKGGGGSDVAAPIAKEIMDFIFNP